MNAPASITCPCCGSKVARAWVWDAEAGVLVTEHGSSGHLNPQEATLVDALMKAKARVIHKDHLINALYGEHDEPDVPDRVLDVIICRLRAKLRPIGVSIRTYSRRGYRLEGSGVALR